MPTRIFTVTELAALGVPPSDPRDIEYDPDLLADEHVATLKYTAQRRCVFRADDDRTYAVEYEGQLDVGDFEVGAGMPDTHGWHGDTVTAVEVEERPVIVARWHPVTDEPAVDEPRLGAVESLAEWLQESGAHESAARESAAWIIQHADEIAVLYDAYLASAEGDL